MVADMASTTIEVTDSTQVLRVRRLKKDFPLHQVNAAILQAVRKLGYDRPTEDQKDAIRSFVEGTDVFICLPTGSGKSLCYACLPILFDILRGDGGQQNSIVVVVSPLSSLMQDQVCSQSLINSKL